MKDIIKRLLRENVKTIQMDKPICKCTYCKKEINTNSMYLRFTGDYLHTDCLIAYMQKLKILDVITSEKDGDKTDE